MGMEEGEKEEYTQDGTVDLRGNPVLRSQRGGWEACSFIVVYEVFERMAYQGIASNLVIYLTKKLHLGTATSSNNVTNWAGTIWLTPVLGAYVADAHLGRYWTFVIASAIYLFGMTLLTLAVSLPSLRPPSCSAAHVEACQQPSMLQLAVFFGALYTLTIGTGGTKPNISTMGAEQLDEFDPKEKVRKISFFNWWMFGTVFGAFFAKTVLVYIQDNVGWTLGYGIPTAGLAVSIIIFLAGTRFYWHKLPKGSPFTKIARIIVAALRKWRVKIPSDPNEFYQLDLEEYSKKGHNKIDYTPSLRFLNKACIKTGPNGPWILSSVTAVEETKQILRMLPMLVASLPSTMLAQVNTLFIKQGATLERSIGNFTIPPASLVSFVTISMLVSIVLYDRFFVKIMRRLTKNPRGITLLQRMGIGIVIHVFIMMIASLTERYRLRVAKDHGLDKTGGQVPLTIFILLPQFLLMGVADAFLEVVKVEFFYDQAPESMKSLGASYSTTSIGIGNFFSSFLLSNVASITKKHGHKGWILNNLNDSHLDYYYAFFAVLNFLNLIYFILVSRFYVYKAEVSDSMETLKEELRTSAHKRSHQEE